MGADTTIKKYDVKVAHNLELGQGGCHFESGTTAVTGNFYAIQFMDDSIFSLLTDANATGDDQTAITYLRGEVIWGQFTAFTLTSGAVRAYSGTPEVT